MAFARKLTLAASAANLVGIAGTVESKRVLVGCFEFLVHDVGVDRSHFVAVVVVGECADHDVSQRVRAGQD